MGLLAPNSFTSACLRFFGGAPPKSAMSKYQTRLGYGVATLLRKDFRGFWAFCLTRFGRVGKQVPHSSAADWGGRPKKRRQAEVNPSLGRLAWLWQQNLASRPA